MTRLLPLSFRSRLFLGAILPALMMVSLLEWVFISRYQADIERAFLDRGRAMARQIGPAAEYALFSGSTETLRALADATRTSDTRILAVSVLGSGGEVLAHSGLPLRTNLPLDDRLRVVDDAERTIVIAPILRSSLPASGDTDLWGDASGKRGQVSGYVVVEISRDELALRQREMLQITIAILLGGLVLAGWLSFRIAGSVLRQLDTASCELRRQKEVAEALARTDALTGLANRRAFDEAAAQELERAKRYATPLTLIMTDLDHFKSINDSHGHHVGDLVLQNFAATLTRSVRGVDLVGRWGGEEFVILMPGTTLDEALQAAERMRLAVASTPTRYEDRSCGYTASFGVAAFKPESPTLDSLLGRADAALYRAKDTGRNRVEAG